MKSLKVCEYSRSRSFHDDLILQDQASGERSQDQWSSGFKLRIISKLRIFIFVRWGLVGNGPFESFSHKNDIIIIINDYLLEVGVCYVTSHHSCIRNLAAMVGRSDWQINDA